MGLRPLPVKVIIVDFINSVFKFICLTVAFQFSPIVFSQIWFCALVKLGFYLLFLYTRRFHRLVLAFQLLYSFQRSRKIYDHSNLRGYKYLQVTMTYFTQNNLHVLGFEFMNTVVDRNYCTIRKMTSKTNLING